MALHCKMNPLPFPAMIKLAESGRVNKRFAKLKNRLPVCIPFILLYLLEAKELVNHLRLRWRLSCSYSYHILRAKKLVMKSATIISYLYCKFEIKMI